MFATISRALHLSRWRRGVCVSVGARLFVYSRSCGMCVPQWRNICAPKIPLTHFACTQSVAAELETHALRNNSRPLIISRGGRRRASKRDFKTFPGTCGAMPAVLVFAPFASRSCVCPYRILAGAARSQYYKKLQSGWQVGAAERCGGVGVAGARRATSSRRFSSDPCLLACLRARTLLC